MLGTGDLRASDGLWREKDKIPVVAILSGNIRVEGVAHLIRNQRLLDMLNAPDQDFIPLTDATVHNGVTGETIKAGFMGLKPWNPGRIYVFCRSSITTIFFELSSIAFWCGRWLEFPLQFMAREGKREVT